jgi:phosphoribosylglycinamide formyltransferase-1
MPARLGILLSGSGSTYANLVEAIARGELPAAIAVVVSSKAEALGLERARTYGHPTVVAAQADAVTAALLAHGAQWVAMCGWLRFWNPPPPFAGRTINIHPSLLPRFGGKGMYGMRVHEAVLAAGETRSGCTVHQVTGDFDSGPILAQAEVPVLPGDTAAALAARVQEAERALYPRVLARLITGS